MTDPGVPPLTIGQCATLACVLEATAPKPGNVHRGADFEDLTYVDLVTSAVAIGPAFEAAAERRVGETVLAAVTATRAAVATNSNLGMILLLAPLATVARDVPIGHGIAAVLAGLDPQDATDVYEAIRLARPGGLGRVGEADVAEPPKIPLIEAMRLAADRDLVARQYANDFHEVLHQIVPWLAEALDAGWPLADAVVHAALRLMAETPDSLIERKCGPAVAREASDRAAEVLQSGQAPDQTYRQHLADLDFWLRADHHRRHPGTTADLIAAGLFVALREGTISRPLRFYPPMI